MGAPSFSERGGGGEEGAVRFQPIQPVVDTHICKLLLQGEGGGGGGGRHSVLKRGAMAPPGDAHGRG